MAKAYFTIPNGFSQFQANGSEFSFLFQDIREGTTRLMNRRCIFTYAFNSTLYSNKNYGRTTDDFASVYPDQPYNVWNPFKESLQLEFDNGNYGTSTGNIYGGTWGVWDTRFHVDAVEVNDRIGNAQNGAFGFTYDDTQNFYWRAKLTYRISGQPLTSILEANYDATTGVQTYTLDGVNILKFGWLEDNSVQPATTQDGNVQKYLGEVIPIPDLTEENREYDVCCPCNLVLASTSDSSTEKNDYFGGFHKVGNGESVTWKLYKDDVEISYAGLAEVNTVNNVQMFTMNWRDVLTSQGEAVYKVSKTITANSIDLYEQFYNSVKLKEFSWTLANGTVRIDLDFNNYLQSVDTDFTNTGFKTSVRVLGHFGNEQYEIINENNYNSELTSVHNYKRIESTYTLEVAGIRACIWGDFPKLYLLADTIKVNDYNQRNYDYKYKEYPVVVESWGDSTYTGNSRQAVYTIEFKDKTLTNISKYNG